MTAGLQEPLTTREFTRDAVREACTSLAAGDPVVLTHDDGAALVFPAASATPAATAFLIRHTSGFLQVAMPAATCDRLLIPRAAPMNSDPHPPSAQCVAVDAVAGTTTGISASDRARTARALADPSTSKDDVTRPGHLVPVAVDTVDESDVASIASTLVGRATGVAVAVFAELVVDDDPLDMPSPASAARFARRHALASVSARAASSAVR